MLTVSLLLDGRRRLGCHQQRPGAFAMVNTNYLIIFLVLGDTDLYYVILSFYSEPIIIQIIGEKTGLELQYFLSFWTYLLD